MKKRAVLTLVTIVLALVSCSGGKVTHYSLNVLAEYPHDVTSYTQGLYFRDGRMFESTGEYGLSTFREVDIQTGKSLRRLDFDEKYFVEGSTVLGDELYVLTWENRVAFIYDANTLEYKTARRYPREGWGLTTDGRQLIASDGSSRLYFMDRELKVTKRLSVTLNGKSVRYLNELEWIDGRIWANVYMTDNIVIINPRSGVVEGVVDCKGLLPKELMDYDTDVLNGIAKDDRTGKIYVTGKNWPRLYEIELIKK